MQLSVYFGVATASPLPIATVLVVYTHENALSTVFYNFFKFFLIFFIFYFFYSKPPFLRQNLNFLIHDKINFKAKEEKNKKFI